MFKLYIFRWHGRCLWGVNHQILKTSSVPEAPGSPTRFSNPTKCIVMSTSEHKAVQSKLSSDFNLCYAAGAGYKILCAVDGLVGAYLLSQVMTFFLSRLRLDYSIPSSLGHRRVGHADPLPRLGCSFMLETKLEY